MNNYEIGEIVKGKVSGIESYGIFLNFENGYSGMIHISEISDKFVKDLNQYAKLEEVIPVKILGLDHETKKMKLSIKDMDYFLRREGYYDENFNILKKMLPIWMEEKLKEIEEKEKRIEANSNENKLL